jgi:hypothetical protein
MMMVENDERTPHEKLFEHYVEDLTAAKVVAELWWDRLTAAEEATGDPKQAADNLRRRWPYGPAAHPKVIAVLRRYYLACVGLNNELGEDDEVYPDNFTTEWLMDNDTSPLGDFIADLPYWPIGLDENVNPV